MTKQLEWEAEQGLGSSHPVWDVTVPDSLLATVPDTCLDSARTGIVVQCVRLLPGLSPAPCYWVWEAGGGGPSTWVPFSLLETLALASRSPACYGHLD